MSTAEDPASPDPDQMLLWDDEPAAPATRSVADQLWSIQDVGHFLDVPVATIYQWRVRGEGPPATRMGKHLRFEPDIVRAWVSEHREGA
jgi:hypothetical protein